ncbi:MAG: hypothetical protein ACK5JM_10245 [Rhodoblastus sp.]
MTVKKVFDWFALVLGVALALFGARWMWTGWDIVQAERGWAAVIAGSAMLSGGLIVAMLAWATMRLTAAFAGMRQPDALATLARPDAQTQSAPTRPDDVVQDDRAQDEPARLFPKPAILAPAAVAAATAGAIFAKREGSGEEARLAGDEAAPSGIAPVEPSSTDELLRMDEDRAGRKADDAISEDPPPLETTQDIFRRDIFRQEISRPEIFKIEPSPADEDDEIEPAQAETQVRRDYERQEQELQEQELQEQELQEQELQERELQERERLEQERERLEQERLTPPPPPPPEAPGIPKQPAAAPLDGPEYDDWLERTAQEFDRELGRDTLPKDAPAEPPPPEPVAAPAESTIVGRYASGDTNYLMFADGSIEAQTPEGAMRFASLTELKRFVETRN